MDEKTWAQIQAHCKKIADEMVEWSKQEHKDWGTPWNMEQSSETYSEKCMYQLQP